MLGKAGSRGDYGLHEVCCKEEFSSRCCTAVQYSLSRLRGQHCSHDQASRIILNQGETISLDAWFFSLGRRIDGGVETEGLSAIQNVHGESAVEEKEKFQLLLPLFSSLPRDRQLLYRENVYLDMESWNSNTDIRGEGRDLTGCCVP